ncbi:hypothetical protein [Acinetobacter sp. NIPH 298]|uniref:hypothetical protein n=1 Tax=Acinetobacter sp. NIPH 298 TaxID=1217692 RepID=UPI0002D0D0A3|nr:hypothetical protein [Acinetobacter sp. NIPH 298]ENW96001.1 hypothetical protein F903_01769 [Acinetobacter sp. NIPH 298]
MHIKPKLLFHGSSQHLERLQPTQAVGDGLKDNAFGIYAIENKLIAQLFAIQYISLAKDARFAIKFENDQVFVELDRCTVDWERVGYVYTLSSNDFVKIDDLQWLSTKSVVPLKIEQINPSDFKKYIRQL